MKFSKYNISRQKFIIPSTSNNENALLKMYIGLAVCQIHPSLSYFVILGLDPVNISPTNVDIIHIHEPICPKLHD